MQQRVLLTVFLLAAGAGFAGALAPDELRTYRDEIRAWQAKRVGRLKSDTGWLTVAGLFWLHEGENAFGCDAKTDIVLPPGSAPGRAGVFVHAHGRTTVRAAAGAPLRCAGKAIRELRLRSDAEDSTDVLELNDLRLFVIKRGDRYGIRMRDLNSSMRKEFTGIETYPIDPAYRLTARFEPYAPPKKIPIPTIIGSVDTMPSPGALVFELQGREFRLDPVQEAPGDSSLFIIFRDDTSGDETYGGGRFLYADRPKDGKTIVDFNKAYNPPCAFTPFATCPLPPLQNELATAVRAGEKNYGHH